MSKRIDIRVLCLILIILVGGFGIGYYTGTVIYKQVTAAKTYSYFLTPSVDRKMVVNVAQFFYDRGKNIQYDDGYLDDDDSLSRAKMRVNPMEASFDKTIYVNDATFIYNVYYNAFDYDLSNVFGGIRAFSMMDFANNVYTVASSNGYYNASVSYLKSDGYDYVSTVNNSDFLVMYSDNSQVKVGDREAVISLFSGNLAVGDIVVVRDNSDSCVSYLYIGGDRFMYASAEASYDEDGVIKYVGIDEVTNEESSKYIIGDEVRDFAVLRIINGTIVLSDFANSIYSYYDNKALSDTSLKDVPKIRLERVALVNSYQTVELGQEIIYTLKVRNNSDAKMSVSVSDKLPSNTSYVSNDYCSDCFDSETGVLDFGQISIDAKSEILINYVVEVSAETGVVETSGGEVSGISFNDISYVIGKKLTSKDEEILTNVYKEGISNLEDFASGYQFVSDVYERALGVMIGSFENIIGGLDNQEKEKYVVKNLYGGKLLDGNSDRTVYLEENYLSNGDIIYLVKDGQEEIIFRIEGRLVRISDTVEEIDGVFLNEGLFESDYFVVIRPSLIMEDKEVDFGNLSVDYDKMIIWKVLSGTTILDVMEEITTSGEVWYYDSEGNRLESGNCQTGDYLEIILGSEKQVYKISVLGDVASDGEVNVGDVAKGYQYLRGTIEMDYVYVLALDVVFDGEILVNDVAKLYQYVRGNIDSLEVVNNEEVG